jgi:hypothetical protein
MAGRVIAFPGVALEPEELSPRERSLLKPPCQLCSVSLGADLYLTCDRCGTRMHSECYWGRIASLDEWKVYIKRVVETDDEFDVDVVCAACRQLEGN